MAHKQSIQRLRNWYATLLRLYPKPYRERFAEPMEQTFNDLLRERAEEDKGLFGFALWIFIETSAGILRETLMTIPKHILRPLVLTAIIMLFPIFGSLYVDDWHWHWYSFVFAGALVFSAALGYELVARRMNNKTYRLAVGVAVITGFAMNWVNFAVGVFGEFDDIPTKPFYWGVILIGLIGATVVRFKPRGMMYVMAAMAIAQMTVPVIALIVWPVEIRHLRHVAFPMLFAPTVAGAFGANAIFAALFIGSALLFRRASASLNADAV